MEKIEESLEELDQSLDAVKSHFLYSSELSDRIMGMLNEEALLHSDKLEPDCDHKETYASLQRGWRYGVDQYRQKGEFDSELIKDVAHKVCPTIVSYRDSSAMINGAKSVHMMLDSEKIRDKMGDLLYRLNHSNNHPAFSAVEFNMYYLFIHPFTDGNGRSGRLLQNLYLYENGIPPVIIKHTERLTYLRHIEDAMIAFKERGGWKDMFHNSSFEEVRFFEYLVDKMKDSTERLSSKISDQHRYEVIVDFGKSEKGAVFSLKNKLRNFFNHSGIPSLVELYPAQNKLIVVSPGDEEILIGFLEKQRKKNGLKNYEIKENGSESKSK